MLLVSSTPCWLVYRLRRELRRRFDGREHPPTKGAVGYAVLRSHPAALAAAPKAQVKLGQAPRALHLTDVHGSGRSGSSGPRHRVEAMETRNLGSSGLKISAIAYGNWLTHGSQVEEDAALACVRQALDEGITTFDTADVYANTKAESVLGKALQGERRESLEIFTKVYWPTGPGKHNDHGLSRKHIMESINGSLERLGTDYVDLYQAHRYDYETPLEETMEAFADVVHSGKAHYIGVSEWRAEEIRARPRAGARAAHPVRLEPAAVQHALAGHRGRGGAHLRGARHRPDRLVADRAGRAHRQVPARGRLTPEGSRATDDKGGADMISRWLERRRPRRGCSSSSRSPTRSACRWPSSPSPGCCRTPTCRRRSSAPHAPSRSPRTSRPPGAARRRRPRRHRRGAR